MLKSHVEPPIMENLLYAPFEINRITAGFDIWTRTQRPYYMDHIIFESQKINRTSNSRSDFYLTQNFRGGFFIHC